MRGIIAASLVLVAGVAAGIYFANRPGQLEEDPPSPPITLTTLSPEQLKQCADPHQLLPDKGTALWCASTHAAWRLLPALLAGTAPVVTAQPELSGWLNAAADPAAYVPAKALFSFAGPANETSISQIREGVRRQFGEEVLLSLQPGSSPRDFIAFARLQVEAAFPIPYADTPDGLSFNDSSGKSTHVRSFGNMPARGKELLPGLRDQPVVLFADPMLREAPPAAQNEFALNLSGEAAEVQVIVASLPRPVSLHAAWDHVQTRIAKFPSELTEIEKQASTPQSPIFGKVSRRVRGNLNVPLIGFEATSSLPELEGTLTSPPDSSIRSATQIIQFRLEKTGAKLKAETKFGVVTAAMPERDRDYIFDRPFLLALLKRGAPQPFFLLWVDNAALMPPA